MRNTGITLLLTTVMLDADAVLDSEPLSADFDSDGVWGQDCDGDGYPGYRDDAHEYYFNTEGSLLRYSQNRSGMMTPGMMRATTS
jgi:hypothetical protein